MKPIFKNTLAVIAGLIVGGVVNMGLISAGSAIIPLPEGVNPADMESIKENMHLFEAKHFLFPFLAHALGTLVGAYLTAFIAISQKINLTVLIGIFFLAGGIINAIMLPAPTWFMIVDLVFAYLPMAWLGSRLAIRKGLSNSDTSSV